jgi:hypothetical protein
VTRYRDGSIELLAEKVTPGTLERVTSYLAAHEADLKPAGSAFEPPVLQADLEALEAATGRSLVRCYGAAKSERDTNAALAVCDGGFWIETLAFGLTSADREDTRAQLGAFFHTFPDYAVTLEGFATSPGILRAIFWASKPRAARPTCRSSACSRWPVLRSRASVSSSTWPRSASRSAFR